MKTMILAILIFVASLSSPALAAKANPTTPKNASHVIIGTIVGVYESIKTDRDFIITNRVAAIRIKEIEKGEGLKNGDLLYAHCSNVGQPAGTRRVPYDPGYQGKTPEEGATLRVYLTRQPYKSYGNLEGAFMVAEKGGFEELGQARKP